MTNNSGTTPYAIIISGPTASGKTDLADLLARHLPLEIINADVGQFYAPLSIGTAKPDLSLQVAPHHLFDIITTPRDISASEFRKLVIEKCTQIWNNNHIPCIVGGSLFYIKSLLFPPFKHVESDNKNDLDSHDLAGKSLWEKLYKIDPSRAEQLHPHDEYRVRRALELWAQTGIKPSLLKPSYNPPFSFRCIFLSPPEKEYEKHLFTRTKRMLEQGWIKEVESLIGTDWEPFLKKKSLIGYSEIIDWINAGKNLNQQKALLDNIYFKTRQYSKRQRLFWRSFAEQVTAAVKLLKDHHAIMQIVEAFGEECLRATLQEDILRDLTSLNLTIQSNKL